MLHLKSNSDDKKHLVLVNTHLYSQHNANGVRLVQIASILHHLNNVIRVVKEQWNDAKCSIIICGDLNSRPQSIINTLITNGVASNHHSEFDGI